MIIIVFVYDFPKFSHAVLDIFRVIHLHFILTLNFYYMFFFTQYLNRDKIIIFNFIRLVEKFSNSFIFVKYMYAFSILAFLKY